MHAIVAVVGRWLLLGVLALCAGVLAGVVGAYVARAEITATWEADGGALLRVDLLNRQTFRVGGVIEEPDGGEAPGYALMRDGSLYLAYAEAGRLWSRRWATAEAPFARIAVLAADEAPPVEVDLKRTGLTETVAGQRGSVWELRRRWSDGTMSLREVVATDAPAVVEATAALARLAETTEADLALEDGPAIGRLARMLDGQGLGLLRLGASLRLREVRFDPLPEDYLAVPPDDAQRAERPETAGDWLERLEGDVLRGLEEGGAFLRGLLDNVLGSGDSGGRQMVD